VEKKKLTLQFLSDPGNGVAREFGLVHTFPEDLRRVYLQFGIDLAVYNGNDSWTLPIPAWFIIDRQSIIRYAETDPDYTVRPEPTHTIQALKAIPRPGGPAQAS
jgi:peroxiredoxin